MIYQELSLAPHMTVTENILLMEPASFGLVRRAAMRQAATDVLAKLGHPEFRSMRRSRRLPAAQQLVEIGRALAGMPRSRARRAHEQPVANRHAAAVCATPS